MYRGEILENVTKLSQDRVVLNLTLIGAGRLHSRADGSGRVFSLALTDTSGFCSYVSGNMGFYSDGGFYGCFYSHADWSRKFLLLH